MITSRQFAILMIAGIVGVIGLQFGKQLANIEGLSAISSAEARVGRPLTPVSVAGVGRRTARRCITGVYRC